MSRRFVVDMTGEWDGSNLKLTEDFEYSDGTTEQRIWYLKKVGEQGWSGTADGVIGEAKRLREWRRSIGTILLIYRFQTVPCRVTFDDYVAHI